MDTAVLEQLAEEQKAMLVLTEALNNASSTDEIEAITAAIQGQAQRLEELGKAIETGVFAELDEDPGEAIKRVPKVEVILTPEQREEVKGETGVDVPSVKIDDPTGSLTKMMPETMPGFVTAAAIDQANRFNTMVQAREELYTQITEALAALEDLPEEAQPHVEAIRKDLMDALKSG